MKTGMLKLIITITCSAFILCGCNESGKIWAKYSRESFCATIRYELSGTEICAKVRVEREALRDTVTVEFSSPEVLRGAIGRIDRGEYRIDCSGTELGGEAARLLLKIPEALAAREAISFEKLDAGGTAFIAAQTERSRIIFDVKTQMPVRAEANGTVCDIITFSWR